MTFYRSPYITCDWPGCYLDSRENLHIYSTAAADIRAKLGQKGWIRLLGLDICDHHPLDDHPPTLTPEKSILGTGVRASCSCGWRDTENTWAPQRSLAIHGWRQHLPQEPDCFEKIDRIRRFGTAEQPDPETPS